MISSGFFPKVNGTSLAVGNLLQSLKKRGHRLILITRRYRGCPTYEQWHGITVIRIGPSGHSAFSRVLLAINQIGISIPKILMEKIDIIHAQGFMPLFTGLVLGFLFRKPVIVTFHGFSYLWHKSTRWRKESTYRAALPFQKVMVRATNAIIAQSEKLKEVIISLYGAKSNKINIVSNLIDEEYFEYAPKPLSEEPIILFVGNLIKVHGADLLIRSVVHVRKRFPRAKFFIVGEGPLRERLEKLVNELNLDGTVIFVGHVLDRRKIAEFYRSAKVVVIPWRYGAYFPSLVALEAMAVGRPIITTLTLDPELYRIGFFKANPDPKDIAEKIESVLFMKDDEYMRLSKTIRKHFEAKYSKNAIISKIESLYLKMLTRR
jgi:glycosyltransferase involved in cell wall biosynthesis